MNREECLKKATDIINGERQTNYGKPEDNFNRIARLWEVYLQNRNMEYLDVINKEDVAIMMMLLKVARLMNNPHHADSWVDVCGYAACGCEMTTTVDVKDFVSSNPNGMFPDVDILFETFGISDKKPKDKKKGKKDGVRK